MKTIFKLVDLKRILKLNRFYFIYNEFIINKIDLQFRIKIRYKKFLIIKKYLHLLEFFSGNKSIIYKICIKKIGKKKYKLFIILKTTILKEVFNIFNIIFIYFYNFYNILKRIYKFKTKFFKKYKIIKDNISYLRLTNIYMFINLKLKKNSFKFIKLNERYNKLNIYIQNNKNNNCKYFFKKIYILVKKFRSN